MTTGAGRPTYVLHPGLPVRWWLTHLPEANEANAFRDELLSSGASLVAVDVIDHQVFTLLAADLGPEHLDPGLANLIFDNVTVTLRSMLDLGILRLVDSRVVALPAFALAGYHDLPYGDALSAALAELTGYPLLIVDRELLGRLRGVARQRPNLQVVWLPDHWGGQAAT